MDSQLKSRTYRLVVHYFTPCLERQLNLPDRAFQRKKLISVSSSVPSSTVVSQLAPRLNRVLRSLFAADTPSSRGAAGGKSLTMCPWKQGRGGSHVSYHSTHVKPSVQFSPREDFFFSPETTSKPISVRPEQASCLSPRRRCFCRPAASQSATSERFLCSWTRKTQRQVGSNHKDWYWEWIITITQHSRSRVPCEVSSHYPLYVICVWNQKKWEGERRPTLSPHVQLIWSDAARANQTLGNASYVARWR